MFTYFEDEVDSHKCRASQTLHEYASTLHFFGWKWQLASSSFKQREERLVFLHLPKLEVVCSREMADISVLRRNNHSQIETFGDERNQVQGRVVWVIENEQPSLVQWNTSQVSRS
jgi:hypothetical protein